MSGTTIASLLGIALRLLDLIENLQVANGEQVSPDVVAARTAARRELARRAQSESSEGSAE